MASPGVTATFTLQDDTGAGIPGKVVFLLIGGGNRQIAGTSLIASNQVTVLAATNGTGSTTLWGNYQLVTQGSTYQISIYGLDSSGNIASTPSSIGSYTFTTGGTFDLSNLPLAGQTQPQPSQVVGNAVITNPNSQQNILTYPLNVPGGLSTTVLSLGQISLAATPGSGSFQILLPNANGTVPLLSTANNWTAANTFTGSGVFTNTQMNEWAEVIINGISPLTEFQALQGGSNHATEGLTSGIAVPSGSTVYQVNGVAGYVNSSSTTSNVVGGYFSGRAIANNAMVWGANPVVEVINGVTAKITGCEIDINQSSGTNSSAFNASLAQDGCVITSGGTNKPRVGLTVNSNNSPTNNWKAAAIFSSFDTYGILVEGGAVGSTGIKIFAGGTASTCLAIVPSDNVQGNIAVAGRNSGDTATVWSIDDAGYVTFAALTLTAATPTGTSGQVSFGTTAGFGNGSSGTAVTTTAKGTGTGPTAPQTVVNYLEIDIAGTKFWMPLVQ